MKYLCMLLSLLWCTVASAQFLGTNSSYGFQECCGPGACVITGAWTVNDDIAFQIGTGADYWLVYDSVNTQFELNSTDVDGGGTDGVVLAVPDGTDYVQIGAGGAWKAGTSDDMICLQETGTAADNICLQTVGDVFYVLNGGGGGVTNMEAASGNFAGNMKSQLPQGGIITSLDTTSPGDVDGAGELEFKGFDDGSTQHEFARILLDVTDASAGAEYADLVAYATTNGTDATEYLRLDSSEGVTAFSTPITVDASDPADAGAIRLDATESICWEASPTGTDVCLATDSFEALTYGNAFKVDNFLLSQNASGGNLYLDDTSAPGSAAGTGAIHFRAFDDGSTNHTAAKMYLDVTDASAGAEYADLVWEATTNGTDATEYMRIDSSAGGVSVPATTKVILDGDEDQDSYIFEAADGTVQIYGNAALLASFNTGTITYYAANFVYRQANAAPIGVLQRFDTTTGDGDTAGTLRFNAHDDAPTASRIYAQIDGIVSDNDAAGLDGDLALSVAEANSMTEYMRLDSSEGTVAFSKPAQLDTQAAASPTEPFACAAGTFGSTQVVNDSDDGAGSQVCYCGMTDDSTYDWLNIADNSACTHY